MEEMESHLDMAKLFKEGTYSDITVKFYGREVKLHRVVLCTRSKYFERAFRDGGQFAENSSKVIELKEDDPTALMTVLRYIYTYEVRKLNPLMNDLVGQQKRLLEVAIVADKYGIISLTERALHGIRNCTGGRTHAGVPSLITQAAERIGPQEALDQFVDEMIGPSSWCFVRCFLEPSFRASLESCPVFGLTLYKKHVDAAMNVKAFRDELAEDGWTTVRFLESHALSNRRPPS